MSTGNPATGNHTGTDSTCSSVPPGRLASVSGEQRGVESGLLANHSAPLQAALANRDPPAHPDPPVPTANPGRTASRAHLVTLGKMPAKMIRSGRSPSSAPADLLLDPLDPPDLRDPQAPLAQSDQTEVTAIPDPTAPRAHKGLKAPTARPGQRDPTVTTAQSSPPKTFPPDPQAPPVKTVPRDPPVMPVSPETPAPTARMATTANEEPTANPETPAKTGELKKTF